MKNFNFDIIKKKARAELLRNQLFKEPLFPKHTIKNTNALTKPFIELQLNPSDSSYTNFLSSFFKIDSFSQKHLQVPVYIILSKAKKLDLLLHATLIYLSELNPPSVPLFVQSVLSAIVPLKSTSSLYNFLDNTLTSFSPKEQIALLKWVKMKLESKGLYLDFPAFSKSDKASKKLPEILEFMSVLSADSQPLSSPFDKVTLKISEIQKSGGEITGTLKIKINNSVAPTAPKFIELQLSQNHTYILGLLIAVEDTVKTTLDSRVRLPVSFFSEWSSETGVLDGKASPKAIIDKHATTLKNRIVKQLPSSFPKALLLETTKNQRIGDDYVWLNTNKSPSGTNLDFVFRKRVKTSHKKPKANK